MAHDEITGNTYLVIAQLGRFVSTGVFDMTTNYGIGFCKKVIKTLENKEDEMFNKLGHGFNLISQDYLTLLKHKRLLEKFQNERDFDLIPSYDPDHHGSLHCE